MAAKPIGRSHRESGHVVYYVLSTDEVLELRGSQFPVIKIKGDIAWFSEYAVIFLVQILLKI